MAKYIKEIHYVVDSVSAKVLSVAIKKIYDHLIGIKYRNGLCKSCGLSYIIDDTMVLFTNSGGRLRLYINFSRKYAMHVKDRMHNLLPNTLRQSVHDLRILKICKQFNCTYESKIMGRDGDSGVNFVLNVKCPTALRLAQENYSKIEGDNLTNSERFRMDKFNNLVYDFEL